MAFTRDFGCEYAAKKAYPRLPARFYPLRIPAHVRARPVRCRSRGREAAPAAWGLTGPAPRPS
jgi:hypothetical protein